MRYRKKIEEIEAMQFLRKDIKKIEEWCGNKLYDVCIERRPNGMMKAMVSAVDGECIVKETDYIIKNDEYFWVCPQAIFRSKYEQI